MLEDLRVTKQHVLQRSSPVCPTNGNNTSTEPKLWPQNSTNLPDIRQKSRPIISKPRRPLQENLTKLDLILSDLDGIDGDTDGYEFQGQSIFTLLRSNLGYLCHLFINPSAICQMPYMLLK